jgi:PBP1b-binding outer membrane lipoprotein LpoB
MKKESGYLMAALLAMFLFSCSTRHAVAVAPVEIKPIHITIDVNIKVDKALDDFFGDIDQTADNNGQPADTQN